MRNHKFGFPGLVLLNVNYPVLMEQGLDDARLAKKGSLEGDGRLALGKLIYSSDTLLVSLFILLMMGGRP